MASVQQDVSIGWAIESTFGTAVTATRWVEFTDEGFEYKPTYVQGEGLRVGSPLARLNRRALGKYDAGGDLTAELYTKGQGLLWQALFGNGVSNLVATGIYQQLFQLATTDFLPSWTFQKGVPLLGGGSISTFQFDGMVCGSGELTIPNSGIATLKTSWLGRKVTNDITYATPSYPAGGEVLVFADAGVSVGLSGVTAPTTTTLGSITTPVSALGINVTEFSLKVDNSLDGAGWRAGGSGLRTRPPAVGLRKVTGTITVEFDSKSWRDAWFNQSTVSLAVTLTGQTLITGSTYPTVQILIPAARLEGDTPNANKGDVISQTIPFTVLDGQVAGAPLYVSVITGDSAL